MYKENSFAKECKAIENKVWKAGAAKVKIRREGSGEVREVIRGTITKQKKKNNIVILINAESSEELEKINSELLFSVRKIARKRELGFYITPVEIASLDAIQDFCDFRLKISALDR